MNSKVDFRENKRGGCVLPDLRHTKIFVKTVNLAQEQMNRPRTHDSLETDPCLYKTI